MVRDAKIYKYNFYFILSIQEESNEFQKNFDFLLSADLHVLESPKTRFDYLKKVSMHELVCLLVRM